MMFDPTEFLPDPHNPFEELALRWRRCEYLLKYRRKPSPTLDDAFTHEAWRFLSDFRQCRDYADHERLAQRHPAISAAYQLFTQAGPLERAAIEARLLARESDETIAQKCHLTPAVVAAHHNVFFAVRPHLQVEFYILNQAIGPKAFRQLTTADRDILLKLFGYHMGGLIVDKLLDYFADPPDCPADLTHLDDQALGHLQEKLRLHAMLLSVTVPANAATVARLPAIRRLLAQAGVLSKADTTDEILSLPAIQAALNCPARRPETGAAAVSAARPVSAETTSNTLEQAGSAIPGPCERQAVPA